MKNIKLADAINKLGASEKVKLLQDRLKKLKESLQFIKNQKH